MAKEKMKFLFLTSFLMAVVAAGNLECAPLTDIPVVMKQPDGGVITGFASGDEFYNWLHDKNGYVIIQDPSTGYYTYAISSNKRITSSSYVVGEVDPETVGLEKEIKLPPLKPSEVSSSFPGGSPANPEQIRIAPRMGTINNLVVFIRFSDEDEFVDPVSLYDGMFNSRGLDLNSVKSYFEEVTYNQLTTSTTFYPGASEGAIVSYRDSLPRKYYQPYNRVSNPDGYQNDAERREREHSLLRHAINSISSQVPSSLNIDGDGDGNVDNICFIIKGGPSGWNSLLWPHQWELNSEYAYINGKRAYTYNLQLQTVLQASGVGVLCHEMLHSLGVPDLYHHSRDGLQPVNKWDVMGTVLNPPPCVGAYTKYRYGSWIPTIPTITRSGIYALNPLSSPNDNAYRIESPHSAAEYFVVEYRKKTGIFEASLPEEGLLVYRIDLSRDGKGNGGGPPDEVFAYRPDETLQRGGTPDRAPLNGKAGRAAMSALTNPPLVLSSGKAAGVSISKVKSLGEVISFEVNLGAADQASGKVVNDGGVGISEVTMTFTKVSGSGSLPAPVKTDTAGNWTQSGFGAGTTYKVTPKKADYTFKPASSKFQAGAAGLNFTGTSSLFGASGQVSSIGGGGVPKVTITFSRVSGTGSVPLPVQTDASGNWTQSGFLVGTTYRATPSSADYKFKPTYRSFNTERTDLNFTGAPNVFSASGSVTAGGSPLSDVTVTFSVVSGTGSAPAPVLTVAGGWSQSGFEAGTVYRITPTKRNYKFKPDHIDISSYSPGLVFKGTSTVFRASGTAECKSNKGGAISEVLMTFTAVSGTGFVPAPVLTNVYGNWTQSGFEDGTTYRVTPSKLNYTFTPEFYEFNRTKANLNFYGTLTFVDPPTLFYPSNGSVVPVDYNSKITFKWNAVPEAKYYRIQVSKNATFTPPFVLDMETDNKLEREWGGFSSNGKTYCWRVMAGNGETWSAWSEVWTFITGINYPGPPILIYPGNGDHPYPVSRIIFTWYPVRTKDGNCGYDIQIAKNPSFGKDDIIFDGGANGEYLSLEGAWWNDGKTYWWRVRAGTFNQRGPWSEIWSFVNGSQFATPVPAFPLSSGSATDVPGTVVTFRWNVPSPAPNFHLQVSRDELFTDLFFNGVVGPGLEAAVPGFPNNGKKFWWKLRAGDGAVWGPWSDTAMAWFTNGAQFLPPTLIAPGSDSQVAAATIPFSWNASGGATNYHLQVSRESTSTNNFANIFFDDMIGNVTEFNLPGFPGDGTAFWWRVKAGKTAEWTDWSDARRFYNGPQGFSAPVLTSPADGSKVSLTTVPFRWKASTGATSYHLQVSGNNAFTNLVLDQNVGNNTGYDLAGFPNNGGTFWWRVRAGNAAKWSSWSTVWSLVNGTLTVPPPALSAPANGSNVSGTKVTFSWGVSSGADNYQLQVSRNESFTNLLFNQVIGYNMEYEVAGFPNDGSTFWWRVKAGNGSIWSAWSSVWSLVNGASLPPTLSAPANGSNAAGTTVSFSWNASTGATGYHLQVSCNQGFTNLFFEQAVGNNTAHDVSGLPNDGSTFWWRVKAGKGATWGNWSSVWSFVNGAPLPPTLSAPANGSNASGTTLSFSWNGSSGATGYHLQVSHNQAFSNLFFDQAVGGNLAHDVSGFPNDGSTFWWRVKAGKGTAWGGWSAAWSFINGTLVIPPPTLFAPANGSNVSGTDVSFSWSASTGATDYHLQISEDAAFTNLAFDGSVGNNTGANLTGFPDDGCTFWWRVRAGNGTTWSAWSSLWSFINGAQSIQPPVLTYPPYGSNYSGVTVPFRWNPSSGANNYYLQISQNQYFTDLIFDGAIGYYPNGADLDGFPNDGCTFWWRVAAGNGSTWSNWSSVWWFVNGSGHSLEAPVPYLPYYGSTQYVDTVTFSWSASSGASFYWLQISHNSSFTDLIVNQSVGNNTTVYVSDLFTHGCTYYWRVIAGNGSTWSNWSSVWWFK
jgi:M6 family metalloprotease-like protein